MRDFVEQFVAQLWGQFIILLHLKINSQLEWNENNRYSTTHPNSNELEPFLIGPYSMREYLSKISLF